jgi:hypothetical protein
MPATEVYRYFWIRTTNQKGRDLNSTEQMRFMKSLAGQVVEAPQDSARSDTLKDIREQARWFLGPGPDIATRVTIVGPPEDALQVVAGADQEISEGGVEIDLLAMPAGWTQRAAKDWINSPVGKVWSHAAIACKLGYSVVTPSPSQ